MSIEQINVRFSKRRIQFVSYYFWFTPNGALIPLVDRLTNIPKLANNFISKIIFSFSFSAQTTYPFAVPVPVTV